jgi:hypothetical protein
MIPDMFNQYQVSSLAYKYTRDFPGAEITESEILLPVLRNMMQPARGCRGRSISRITQERGNHPLR